MRAGKFGPKAGRVAIVVAFVLGTLVPGAAAANAAGVTAASGAATEIGQQAQTSVAGLAHPFENEWG